MSDEAEAVAKVNVMREGVRVTAEGMAAVLFFGGRLDGTFERDGEPWRVVRAVSDEVGWKVQAQPVALGRVTLTFTHREPQP